MRDRVHFGCTDAGLLRHRRLDQPAARRAIHAADVNRCFALTVPKLGKGIEHVVTVEHAPLGSLIRRPADAGVGRLAQVVIAAHAGVANQLGDGLAAGTAYGAVLALDVYG